MNRVAVSAVVIPIAFLALLLWTRRAADPPPSAPINSSRQSQDAASSRLSPTGATMIDGIARVIDGDTIEVSGTRIRLDGIDAPEGAQTCRRDSGIYLCGREATDALSNFANGKAVRCTPTGSDQFKRVLATCSLTASGIDLGAWMVSQGFAFAFVRYSRRYTPEEQAAANARRGFWSGSFDYPWEYRARLRSGTSNE